MPEMGKCAKSTIVILLFLFQYALVIPLVRFVNPTYLVGIASLCLCAVQFSLFCRRRVPRSIVFTALLLVIVGCMKVLTGSDARLLFYIATIAFPAFYVVAFCRAMGHWLVFGIRIALVSFLVNCFIPFLGEFEYMRFGYGMVLSFLIALLFLFRYWEDLGLLYRIGVFALALVSGAEAVVWGPRGVLVVIAIAFVCIAVMKARGGLLPALLIVFAVTALVLILPFALNWAIDFAQELGLSSYSLRKMQVMLTSGLAESSSGRDSIYLAAIGQILAHPLEGSPIMFGDGTYVHNIFLQAFQDLGVFGFVGSVVVLVLSAGVIASSKYTIDQRLFMVFLLAVAYGRLMFSSMYWLRPEFWMLFGYAMITIRGKGRRGSSSASVGLSGLLTRTCSVDVGRVKFEERSKWEPSCAYGFDSGVEGRPSLPTHRDAAIL